MRKPLALLIFLALVAAALTAALVEPRAAAAKGPRLQRFGSCDELLGYARRNARRIVGPYGLGGVVALPVGAGAPVEEGAADSARSGAPGVDYSTTNVQEEGVDEPDIVKTDGERLFAVAQGKLHAVDVGGPGARLLGSLQLDLGWNHQLFLHGDRVLVLAGGGGPIEPLPAAESSVLPVPQGSALTEVDVSDPSAMRVVRTLEVDGAYLSARLTGSTARVVFGSTPVLPRLVAPGQPGVETEAEARQRNRSAVSSARLRSWLPYYRLKGRSGKVRHRALVGCRSVGRPAQFSGLGMLTVLTIDLAKGLEPVDSDAIMSDGQTVYASPESLYVATQKWVDPIVYQDGTTLPPKATTTVHKFDVSDPGKTEYRASGEVAGYLLNQFSLSEHQHRLRVASTEQPVWWGDVQSESESFVTVLEEQSGKLVQVGRVGGLGRGERIHAVRFIGDVGYVVTFRQVDPLYTVDLSDPASPRVRGELKILGYSAYLHPLGGDLLLGVGQDATEEGRVLGTQLSIFDVSSLAKPVRLHHRPIAQGWSEAEWDHHAFLFWPRTELAVLPIQASSVDRLGKENGFVGALGFRTDRSGITLVGRVTHPTSPQPEVVYPPAAPIRRALVVGDTLYTVSDTGVKASGLGTLADRAWVPFA